MKVHEVMRTEVLRAGPATPVRELALTMLNHRISGLPVVDDAGRVLGIVSEGDLIRRPELQTDRTRAGWLEAFVSEQELAREFVKSHGRTAREVMSSPAVCIEPQAPLSDAVRLMERHRIKRLPVVEEGRLVGLVTRADLVSTLVMRQGTGGRAAPGDRQLRERIEELLRRESWAASAMVNVIVEGGVVQLWGTVQSAEQRAALMLAVRELPGVREVQPFLGRSLPG